MPRDISAGFLREEKIPKHCIVQPAAFSSPQSPTKKEMTCGCGYRNQMIFLLEKGQLVAQRSTHTHWHAGTDKDIIEAVQ